MVNTFVKTANKDLYSLALKAYDNGEVDSAKKMLEGLIDTEYNDSSLTKLANIHMDECSFDLARKSLELRKDKDSLSYYGQMQYLEENELNFNKSYEYLEKLMQDPSNQSLVIYKMIHVMKSLGEVDYARKLCDLMRNNAKYDERILFELCGMDLEIKDYESIKKRIDYFGEDNLSSNGIKFSKLINGLINGEKILTSDDKFYTQIRYFDKTDKLLYGHLEKHMEGNDSRAYFFKYINLPKLVADVNDMLKFSNPSFFNMSYVYILNMNSIVGLKNGKSTKTLKVCQIVGSPNIVTMYPVSVSDHYNEEGFLENEKILQKRKDRIKCAIKNI